MAYFLVGLDGCNSIGAGLRDLGEVICHRGISLLVMMIGCQSVFPPSSSTPLLINRFLVAILGFKAKTSLHNRGSFCDTY